MKVKIEFLLQNSDELEKLFHIQQKILKMKNLIIKQ